MFRYYLLVTGFCFTLICCKQKNNISIQQKANKQNEFFPVTQIIKGELSEIDSLPVTPMRVISSNGKDDSSWAKREDIRSFAQPFLSPEIDSGSMAKFFVETSFLDQTINAFTFSYDPVNKLPDSEIIRNWNVYVDPEKNKISRIYIVKKWGNKDNSQTTQLTWTSGKWCKITTITEMPGKPPQIKDEKMIWGFDE